MKCQDKENRRQFLKKLIATLPALGIAPQLAAAGSGSSESTGPGIPLRDFGKTGKMVTQYGLGGQGALEELSCEEKALNIIERAIELGINYFDTSAFYGQDGPNIFQAEFRGMSERRLGKATRARRKELFLATKTLERGYDGAMRDLEKSLNKLQTDYLDLWQVHAVLEKEVLGNDSSYQAMKEGIFKAMRKAFDEGMVKNTGITGHSSPEAMNHILKDEDHAFDSILIPLNAADVHRKSFIKNVIPMALEKQMAIVGMKIPARGKIFSKGGILTMREAMSYTLSLPVSTIIVGINDIAELEENVKVAKAFTPLDEDGMLALENKTKAHEDHIVFYKSDEYWRWPQGTTTPCQGHS